MPDGASGKDPLAKQETEEMSVPSLDLEDSLEKGMATHSSILAWRISQTEEPAVYNPWSMGSQRVDTLSY